MKNKDWVETSVSRNGDGVFTQSLCFVTVQRPTLAPVEPIQSANILHAYLSVSQHISLLRTLRKCRNPIDNPPPPYDSIWLLRLITTLLVAFIVDHTIASLLEVYFFLTPAVFSDWLFTLIYWTRSGRIFRCLFQQNA